MLIELALDNNYLGEFPVDYFQNSSRLFFKFKIQIQNSLLLPIYSFGHTYIQFVFKYNNIHT